MSRKGSRNRYYAFDTGEERGVVESWAACEAKVTGRRARYRGFPDRAAAEAWLAGEPNEPSERQGPRKVYAWLTDEAEGIAESWDECEALVNGRRARYRGFADRAAARAWLLAGARYEDRTEERAVALRDYPEDAVFFDSGTGRGVGTEVQVVDRDRMPVAHLAAEAIGARGELTEHGTVLLGRSRTNNFGELLGCLLAIRAAEVLGSRHVYGDSQLVLDYWSRGHVTADKRRSDPELARLANETAAARRRFEAAGGSLGHVPGGLNPADLGFHRE
jgi:ribonuclease H-related protein